MLIGCGGWQYFNAPGDKLLNYSRLYNFVEVNSTFYGLPKISTVKKWRAKVPYHFSFAVKANRRITHDYPFEITERNIQIMNHLVKINEILRTSYLVIQTPPYYHPTQKNLSKVALFLEQSQGKNLELFWEIRGPFSSFSQKEQFKLFCVKNGITHVTDLFRDLPMHVEKDFYTRIFGRGDGNKWELSNQEIRDVHSFLKPMERERKVVVSFHTMRMENDAIRFGHYDKTNSLLSFFPEKGAQSVLNSIKESNQYPISKASLIAEHGWKLFNTQTKEQIRLSNILHNIRDKIYTNYREIQKEIIQVLSKPLTN